MDSKLSESFRSFSIKHNILHKWRARTWKRILERAYASALFDKRDPLGLLHHGDPHSYHRRKIEMQNSAARQRRGHHHHHHHRGDDEVYDDADEGIFQQDPDEVTDSSVVFGSPAGRNHHQEESSPSRTSTGAREAASHIPAPPTNSNNEPKEKHQSATAAAAAAAANKSGAAGERRRSSVTSASTLGGFAAATAAAAAKSNAGKVERSNWKTTLRGSTGAASSTNSAASSRRQQQQQQQQQQRTSFVDPEGELKRKLDDFETKQQQEKARRDEEEAAAAAAAFKAFQEAAPPETQEIGVQAEFDAKPVTRVYVATTGFGTSSSDEAGDESKMLIDGDVLSDPKLLRGKKRSGDLAASGGIAPPVDGSPSATTRMHRQQRKNSSAGTSSQQQQQQQQQQNQLSASRRLDMPTSPGGASSLSKPLHRGAAAGTKNSAASQHQQLLSAATFSKHEQRQQQYSPFPVVDPWLKQVPLPAAVAAAGKGANPTTVTSPISDSAAAPPGGFISLDEANFNADHPNRSKKSRKRHHEDESGDRNPVVAVQTYAYLGKDGTRTNLSKEPQSLDLPLPSDVPHQYHHQQPQPQKDTTGSEESVPVPMSTNEPQFVLDPEQQQQQQRHVKRNSPQNAAPAPAQLQRQKSSSQLKRADSLVSLGDSKNKQSRASFRFTSSNVFGAAASSASGVFAPAPAIPKRGTATPSSSSGLAASQRLNKQPVPTPRSGMLRPASSSSGLQKQASASSRNLQDQLQKKPPSETPPLSPLPSRAAFPRPSSAKHPAAATASTMKKQPAAGARMPTMESAAASAAKHGVQRELRMMKGTFVDVVDPGWRDPPKVFKNSGGRKKNVEDDSATLSQLEAHATRSEAQNVVVAQYPVLDASGAGPHCELGQPRPADLTRPSLDKNDSDDGGIGNDDGGEQQKKPAPKAAAPHAKQSQLAQAAAALAVKRLNSNKDLKSLAQQQNQQKPVPKKGTIAASVADQSQAADKPEDSPAPRRPVAADLPLYIPQSEAEALAAEEKRYNEEYHYWQPAAQMIDSREVSDIDSVASSAELKRQAIEAAKKAKRTAEEDEKNKKKKKGAAASAVTSAPSSRGSRKQKDEIVFEKKNGTSGQLTTTVWSKR